jgi:hypothetical protein
LIILKEGYIGFNIRGEGVVKFKLLSVEEE